MVINTDIPHTESPPQAPGRWSRLAPLLGLLFVVCVLASIIISNTPNTSNSPGSILSYYREHQHRVEVGAFFIAPAIVLGLGWFAYLRNWLQRPDVNERWGTLAFAGGILFAVTGGLAGGLLFALTDTPKNLTASTAVALNFIQGDVPFIMASAAFGVMAIAAGIAMIRSRALPTWLGWFSLVVGILGALPVGDFFALPAIGIWTLIVVGVMWFRTDPQGGLVE
jgi:hypothetical protein